MKYRKLGTTNLDVSVICLGTMTWGEQNNQDDGFKRHIRILTPASNHFMGIYKKQTEFTFR